MADKGAQNAKRRMKRSPHEGSRGRSVSKQPKYRHNEQKKKKTKRCSSDDGGGMRPSKIRRHHQHISPSNINMEPLKSIKTNIVEKHKLPVSGKQIGQKKDIRLFAKEMAEARKKRRKPHYSLERELAILWEKMRCHNIAKEERSKLITKCLEKMKGKIPQIASSHVSSRVLQTCMKYCSHLERDAVFEELKPHFLILARNPYTVHLLEKMLARASKAQLQDFITTLHGHVASLLRHMVGSVVVEHAFRLANRSQRQGLLSELYSAELQLFKDLKNVKGRSLLDIISELSLQKSSVLQHVATVITPILEKGIVDHSIIHCALMEYLTIADQNSARDVLQQLSGPLLVRVIHTREGSRLGILCIKHGSANDRKKIIKAMKEHICRIACDLHGCLVLVSILSLVDDTKLVTKIIINVLQKNLKELIMNKNGRRPLLQLLCPNSPHFLSPDDLASLSVTIPSLSTKDGGIEGNPDTNVMDYVPSFETDNTRHNRGMEISTGGLLESKKDPSARRFELLIDSGLAEALVDTCTKNAGGLLRSKFGSEVIYEIASGGMGGLVQQTLADKLKVLYENVAALAALPKVENAEEEHLFENFYSSRTIKKLILQSSIFADILWQLALKQKCDIWSQGHSIKIVSAFLESSDNVIQQMAREELQPLLDGGILKLPKVKQMENEKE